MEEFESIENKEEIIDGLVETLASKEGMDPDFIISDIAMFAPYEGNDAVNLEYLAELAEKLGISVEEMHAYAIKKTRD